MRSQPQIKGSQVIMNTQILIAAKTKNAFWKEYARCKIIQLKDSHVCLRYCIDQAN